MHITICCVVHVCCCCWRVCCWCCCCCCRCCCSCFCFHTACKSPKVHPAANYPMLQGHGGVVDQVMPCQVRQEAPREVQHALESGRAIWSVAPAPWKLCRLQAPLAWHDCYALPKVKDPWRQKTKVLSMQQRAGLLCATLAMQLSIVVTTTTTTTTPPHHHHHDHHSPTATMFLCNWSLEQTLPCNRHLKVPLTRKECQRDAFRHDDEVDHHHSTWRQAWVRWLQHTKWGST